MREFLNQSYFNNTVQDYLVFLAILLGSSAVIAILKHILLKRLEVLVKKTKQTYDDLLLHTVEKYLMPMLYFGALYFSTKALTLCDLLQKSVDFLATLIAIVLGAMLVSSLLILIFTSYWNRRFEDSGKYAAKWIASIIKFVVWVIALLLFLDNIHVEVNTLVASLGIGSIAVAFAAQAVLSDLLSFFAIIFDRPFELGDFIIVGDLMGTVEHIGIKTTRLRSLSGEQLIFSNLDLTSSRLKNYKTLKKRRILFTLGVTYDTTPAQLKEIPQIIKTIIGETEGTEFDRAHFTAYGDFSLNFEIVYYVLSDDYNTYMDLQQAINLKIKEEFDRRGIQFAFPTQTLYLHGEASGRASAQP
ncbi:MAG: mechanosensitive ion channel family protein [Oscillospiraceae bacterium]